MSEQMSVSISTVMQAYQLLEDRGLVEPRPQSGHFVRPKHCRRVAIADAPPEPEMLRLPLKPGLVRTEELVMRSIQLARRPGAVLLGTALPSSEFLPTESLNRILARVVRENPAIASQYEFSPGLRELREQIARRAMDTGCSLGPDDIIITTGATEALLLSLRAVTEPGDTVAVESPCYFGFLHLLKMLRLQAVEVSTDPRAGISIDELEKLVAKNPGVKALILVPNVHNPLGNIMPDENKRHIAERMQRSGIPIIEDDICGDLAFDLPRPRCIKTFGRADNVLLCGSFSKTLAPGYRVGWVAAGRWHHAVNELKLISSFGSATPPQLAIASYLATGGFDRHLRRLRKTYRGQLQLLSDSVLRSFPTGTRATRPAGGHLLWVELPKLIDTQAFHEELAAADITLSPGSMFSAGRHYRNCLRLNAGIPWSAKVEKAVKTIGRLADRLLTGAT